MWDIFHHAYAKNALLPAFVIFIAISKRILICFQGTDCCVVETLPYILHTHRYNSCFYTKL